MGLHEPFVVPDGYRLFEGGLCADTLRDVGCRDGWRGVAEDEAELLERWLEAEGERVWSFHTDVPVGMIPDAAGLGHDECIERMCCASNPLRIDAVARVDGVWRVIEVKAHAGYQALGQVLTYGFYKTRAHLDLAGAELWVVTDKVQECIRPVYARFGVRVVEVGVEGWVSG